MNNRVYKIATIFTLVLALCGIIIELADRHYAGVIGMIPLALLSIYNLKKVSTKK